MHPNIIKVLEFLHSLKMTNVVTALSTLLDQLCQHPLRLITILSEGTL